MAASPAVALKGTLGNALHAVLCGCGHNIRMILAHLRAIWAEILAMLMAIVGTTSLPKSTGIAPRAFTA